MRMMHISSAVLRPGVALALAMAPNLASAQIVVPAESESPSTAAQVRLTPACVAARRYIDLGREHKAADIGTLFAETVDYVGPDGVTHSTGRQVADVYAAMSKTDWARLSEVHLYRLVPLNQNECFMEFSSGPPSGPILYAIDHFIVNGQGKVIWFRPFFQQAFRF